MSEVGIFIRLKRIEKGLSQRSLAKESGLSSGMISMIERGDRSGMRAVTVNRIARVLGIEPDEVLRRLPD